MNKIIKRILVSIVIGLVADAATTKIKKSINNSTKINDFKEFRKARNEGIIDVKFTEVN